MIFVCILFAVYTQAQIKLCCCVKQYMEHMTSCSCCFGKKTLWYFRYVPIAWKQWLLPSKVGQFVCWHHNGRPYVYWHKGAVLRSVIWGQDTVKTHKSMQNILDITLTKKQTKKTSTPPQNVRELWISIVSHRK